MSDEPLDFTLTRLPFFLRPEQLGTLDATCGAVRLPRAAEKAFGTWGDQIDRYTESLGDIDLKRVAIRQPCECSRGET